MRCGTARMFTGEASPGATEGNLVLKATKHSTTEPNAVPQPLRSSGPLTANSDLYGNFARSHSVCFCGPLRWNDSLFFMEFILFILLPIYLKPIFKFCLIAVTCMDVAS